MSKMPAISIIMPVYNSEKYLKKSINSILNQTFSDIELICIEDCSSDASLHMLRKFKKMDSRINIIKNKKNMGPGLSRNVGIRKARGEYVCFLDSDDWLEKDACELLYKKAKKGNLDVVYIWPRLVFSNRTIEDNRLLDLKEVKNKDTVLRKNLMRKVSWAPWSKMIRRSLLIKNNIFFPNIYIAEDMDFSVKVIYYSDRIGLLGKYLYNYNLREGSLMSYVKAKRRIKNYFTGISLMEKFLKDKKIFDKYKKEFIYFKLYNYLAIYGVIFYSDRGFDTLKYKKDISKDTDFKFFKIMKLFILDSVIIGSFLIKLGLFNPAFRVREYFRIFFNKWGRRNN